MKHMSREDRDIIELNLNEGNNNFTKIGKNIGYHRTTISNEIIKHKIPAKLRTYGRLVPCKFVKDCAKINNSYCNHRCDNFESQECEFLAKPPYVCNGCKRKNTCGLQRFYYRAKEAQEIYESDLINSRTGLNIPEETINKINTIIAPLIKVKHQTINQVYINHPEILYFSKSEFYNLINNGYVSIKPIDLPRAVKYRKRKSSTSTERVTRQDSKRLIGRTYNDYKTFITENQVNDTIQIDCVEGKKGGKVILTIHSVLTKFMFMYLLNEQTSLQVTNKISYIKNILGFDLYIKIFYCCLTDNGSEFFDYESFENINNCKHCNLFYCDSGHPEQKGSCEENHHYIRYYFPKKECDFDDLTQQDCNLLMSNINSVPREGLDGKTPFDEMTKLLSSNLLNKLGCIKIQPDEVNLSSSIFEGRGLKK